MPLPCFIRNPVLLQHLTMTSHLRKSISNQRNSIIWSTARSDQQEGKINSTSPFLRKGNPPLTMDSPHKGPVMRKEYNHGSDAVTNFLATGSATGFFLRSRAYLSSVTALDLGVSTGSGNGLAPNRRQVITWTNAGPVVISYNKSSTYIAKHS